MLTFRHLIMNTRRPLGLAAVVAVVLLAAACTSRYRLEMFTILGENRSKIKIERTEYYVGVVLSDPKSQDKVIRGDGNCLVLITGTRGQNVDDAPQDILTFDRYERFRVFLQLPAVPSAGTFPLKEKSFVYQLGRYELSDEERIYFPLDGNLVVDSIVKDRLFGTLDARYENGKRDSLAFQGKFRAKVAE